MFSSISNQKSSWERLHHRYAHKKWYLEESAKKVGFQTKQFQTSPSPLRKHDGCDVYGVFVVLVVDEDKEEEKVTNSASDEN